MFIEEIILDGFKSYSTRTVISGFDPKFNAITGLNGSGKSNILDAICFVLGISNLSQVRVSNLQELVYKQGQAGITKASVTILFNNEIREESPIGYEQYDHITVCRQIVIGGRNKYLINGHTAQANQVQNLFHSVQLNVNNPHFLIMQGRITKVLNMKPVEILGMIEEAAGTKMYEMNRQKALQTLEKKEVKVLEINRILNEEITPTLEKLQSQKNDYLRWLSNQTEKDRLGRLIISFQYSGVKTDISEKRGGLLAFETSARSLEAERVHIEKEISASNVRITELTSQVQADMEHALEDLTNSENELSKAVISRKSQLESAQKLIEEDESSRSEMKSQLEQQQQQGRQLEERRTVAERRFNSAEETKQRLESVQKSIQLSGSNRVELARKAISQLQTKRSNLELLLKECLLEQSSLQKKAAELEREIQSSSSASAQLRGTYERAEGALQRSEADFRQIESSYQEFHRLQEELEPVQRKRSRLEEALRDVTNQIPNYPFEFRDPTPQFDRRRVFGELFMLFDIQHPEMIMALEIIGGGKLYQIVVDSPETGKALISNGGLRQRYTFIPLSGINHYRMGEDKLRIAKSIAGEGNVFLALDVITYRPELTAAMEYVFGNTLICSTSDIAQKLAFHKSVNVRTVTLDGDCYEPQGTLQGGSSNQKNSLLTNVQALKAREQERALLEESSQSYSSRLRELGNVESEYQKRRDALEIQRHEFENLRRRLEGQSALSQEQELRALQEAQGRCEEKRQSLEQSLRECDEQRQREENSLRDLQVSGQTLTASDMDAKEVQKRLKAAESEYKAAQNEFETLDIERNQLGEEYSRGLEKLVSLEREIAGKRAAYTRAESEYGTSLGQYEQVKRELREKQNSLVDCHGDIKKAVKAKEKLEQKLSDMDLQDKKLAHQLVKAKSDLKEREETLDRMIKDNPWIPAEERFFGQPDSMYNYGQRSIKESKKRLEELSVEQDQIERKINKKVLGMIDKAIQDYQDLKQKKAKLENDKQTIEKAIEDLDQKKIETLQTTWQKVNTDFASIFSTLLPSTTAKIIKVNEHNISEGLEIKVAFAGKFKENLSELSGGQRSLLALSLVLAMLLYKPAPMYILDEVDAALDLSHTQNIGVMLRKHFQHSQFIIVSLKEGMFNNANVVFRTKFVDGISTVTRTVNRSS